MYISANTKLYHCINWILERIDDIIDFIGYRDVPIDWNI